MIILALPRGGVPIGFEIARELEIPLDVLVVRKIGAPDQPEFGIGAVTEDGYYWIDQASSKSVGVTDQEIHEILLREENEINRRKNQYRQDRHRIDVEGKTVILVDDGLATGVTARVAAHYLRGHRAAQIVLAVPVCASQTAEYLKSEIDEVICLEKPPLFLSVGQFYEDFSQVSDEEVVSLLSQSRKFSRTGNATSAVDVLIEAGPNRLPGSLMIPPSAFGVVIFAHGSGSSRLSPRNQQVAQSLNHMQIGTLLFDLLSEEESPNQSLVFDIPFLARRLVLVTQWLKSQRYAQNLPIGYFGASTGAGAALWAASELDREITAIVSRGGRPDLAISKLPLVSAPTLLLVGELDEAVIEMNREALQHLKNGRLVIIPGATHLFEESGALEEVTQHATEWFGRFLATKADKKAAA